MTVLWKHEGRVRDDGKVCLEPANFNNLSADFPLASQRPHKEPGLDTLGSKLYTGIDFAHWREERVLVCRPAAVFEWIAEGKFTVTPKGERRKTDLQKRRDPSAIDWKETR